MIICDNQMNIMYVILVMYMLTIAFIVWLIYYLAVKVNWSTKRKKDKEK